VIQQFPATRPWGSRLGTVYQPVGISAKWAAEALLTRYPNYTVVYRPETVPLEVVAVLDGKRNIRRILKTALLTAHAKEPIRAGR
jgi:hypothetical protein